ncbi:MAG: cation diffusion facilitator family transporter, partial [Bacillota bacterium]
HGPANYNTAFALGTALNVAFIIVEVFFGPLSDSIALLADAGHNLSDVLGLLLAWGAFWLSQTKPTARRTYGLRRSSILAALANAIILLLAVGAIAWEAIQRFAHPAPVAGLTVMLVAGIGILVNGGTALLFMAGRKHDVNIEGAFLHMAADAAVSLGVLVAGGIIAKSGWLWLDPTVSLVIVAAITIGTWDLLCKSLNLAMDAVPRGIDPAAVREYLASVPGVTEVHDLHIWGMSTTETALTVHLIKPDAPASDSLLAHAAEELHRRFRIGHATIQVEHGDGHPCKLACDDM